MRLITDDQLLVGAKGRFGTPIPVYDDGYGQLYIHRDSLGITGIVRARSWEDAYNICEDEFFPTADDEAFETPYDQLSAHEQECWDEAYGYRPNGQGGPTPDKDRGVYAKDLNGASLDILTSKLISELELTLDIS